jgi:N-acetylglucosaminyldiphosphoundecaprenol N-acetyl-beta-D-mannosaminyltransferase
LEKNVNVPRSNILGVGISTLDLSDTVSLIHRWVEHGEKHYVCLTNVHSIIEAQHDPTLRDVYNRAGLATPDGIPLVWLSQLQGFARCERVYGPDLMLKVCEPTADKRFRHFFYGGGPGTAERLREKLTQRFPSLQVVGTHSPPARGFGEIEDPRIIEGINAAAPQIVWVGLGAPKQERWMADHQQKLNANVLIGVGAAFDFFSGGKRQAPLWMRKSGLEWLFRLLAEPRRLGPRYLRTNPEFVLRVLGTALHLLPTPKIDPEAKSQ